MGHDVPPKHHCPSQIFVRPEMIDKILHSCQSKIMIETLGNIVLVIWSKTKISSNLAAENLAPRHQLTVMKRINKRPKIRMADRLFWVIAGFQCFRTNRIEPDAPAFAEFKAASGFASLGT